MEPWLTPRGDEQLPEESVRPLSPAEREEAVRDLLQHRDGLMLDVATILTSLRLRMNEMSARSVGSGRALVSLVFQVHNLTELQNVMARLRGISGVSAVRRAEG